MSLGQRPQGCRARKQVSNQNCEFRGAGIEGVWLVGKHQIGCVTGNGSWRLQVLFFGGWLPGGAVTVGINPTARWGERALGPLSTILTSSTLSTPWTPHSAIRNPHFNYQPDPPYPPLPIVFGTGFAPAR